MAYRKRKLSQTQTEIPLEPLRGRQLMKRDRASSVHATGDRVLTHGRRILATVGINGAENFHVSSDPVDEEATSHPLPGVERIVARLPPLPLTPGHFVRVEVVANPSGKTQTVGFEDAGAQGSVKVTATYNNGGAVVVENEISIPGGNEALLQGDGAAWFYVRRESSPLLLPANMNQLSNLAAWSDGVTVELVIAYIGAPRVIDLCVYEHPYEIAYDTSGGGWIVPLHGDGTGANLGQLPGTVPVVVHSAADAGHGAEVLISAARRQCQELGPVLFYFTAWDESNQNITATETDAQAIETTTWTDLFTGVTTPYDADGPGWSLASGANARRVQESEHLVVMRDTDNVVPVKCWIYARVDKGGGTAKVRFESADYSITEVAVSGTSWGWHSATGTLRCGLGAQDVDSVIQARAQCSAGVTLEWRYICVVFADL